MPKTLAQVAQEHESSPEGASRIAGLKRTLEHVAGPRSRRIVMPEKSRVVRFAITGDRHHGNLCCDVAALRAFYAEVKRRGIDTVVDAGDMLDGHGVYRGQEFELKDVGFDAQARAFAKESPLEAGITTHFITGNHDASFTRKVGVSVGEKLAELRPDYKFLGQDVASLTLTNASGAQVMVGLIHPDGGTAYALSYKPQKIVEQLEGGSKPSILGIGHFHKSEWIPSYRNVSVLQTGCFERQTPFMARNGLSAHVGGWILEWTGGKGCNSLRAEFLSFY